MSRPLLWLFYLENSCVKYFSEAFVRLNLNTSWTDHGTPSQKLVWHSPSLSKLLFTVSVKMCVCIRFYLLKVQTYNFIQSSCYKAGKVEYLYFSIYFLSIYSYLASILWSSQSLIPKYNITYLFMQCH